jgi:alcohol dehydrogenase (cytochrome c)
MTRIEKLLVTTTLCLIPGIAGAQALDPAVLQKPLGSTDAWPTYSGDYTGKRYSTLKQINQTNVRNLTLAWLSRMTTGAGGGGFGGRGGGAPTIVGGEGTTDAGGNANIRASILQVDGILYVATPDNAWAVDARDGHEIWHYYWKTKGGTHIGNRGLGMWGNWLYMETPDDYLVCLDAVTGKEVAQGDCQLQPAVLLHHGAGCDREPYPDRHR